MTQSKKRFAAHILFFDCDQFILRAIENCAPFVEKIYIARSQLPWQYNAEARQQFQNQSDKDILKLSRHFEKIELIEGDWAYEEDQRNSCLERARLDGFDYLIVHDADEFYRFADYRDNIRTIEENPDFDLYKTPWCSFWKSLDYILVYKDGGHLLGHPEFAINCKTEGKFVRARSTDAARVFTLNGTCFHLSYVLTDDQVLRKINTWGHAHQFDTRKWYRDKWLNWHEGLGNLHPVQPGEWRKAVRYTGDLPEVLRGFVSPQITVKRSVSPLRSLQGRAKHGCELLRGGLRKLLLPFRRARLACTWRFRAAKLKAGPGLGLHLGCGEKRYQDMLNCEYRTTRAADLVFDCSRLTRFGDRTVDRIFSHAFFEHLYRPQQLPLLLDCFRVLSADGTIIFLGLPDFEVIAGCYLEGAPSHLVKGESFDLYHVYRYTHGDPEIAADYWLEQLHKSLFDKRSVRKLLLKSGFVNQAVFNYCYPGEDVALNIGFVASKSSLPVGPRIKELLFPFRECLADLDQITLYEDETGGFDRAGGDSV
jgi:Uncharacterized protein conserved in bacteria